MREDKEEEEQEYYEDDDTLWMTLGLYGDGVARLRSRRVTESDLCPYIELVSGLAP